MSTENVGIRLSYFICGTPRTGSWLLTEALRGTGIAGNPDEYFAHQKRIGCRHVSSERSNAFDEFLRRIRRAATTSNGVLGIKLHLDQFEHLMCALLLHRQQVRPERVNAILNAVFPGLRFVWVIRRDKVRQALSWWRALRDDAWFQYSDVPGMPERALHLDFEAVHRLHRTLIAQENLWAGYFDALNIAPVVVEYESLADSYAATVKGVMQALGIADGRSVTIAPPRLVKMADDRSNEWAASYHSWQEMQERGLKVDDQ
jgi:LPS sulfotransferase NodH